MSILKDWKLEIDADDVLRAQGAIPVIIRLRSPRAVAAAERAVAEGLPILEPAVGYVRRKVVALHHERLKLAGGGLLSGPLVSRHLAASSEVVAMVCTAGGAIEREASAAMGTDPAFALALDAVGSVAVDRLAAAACSRFGSAAEAAGVSCSVPVGPGLEGWSVAEGQCQLFDILGPATADVALTSSGQMIPRKSITLVIGFGRDIQTDGRPCDYCGLRATCRFQEQYV